jgi:hypothetical protein
MSGMIKMGGNKTHACFCRTPEIQFFFFGLTWKTPRQREMEAGRTGDGRLEFLCVLG